MGTPEDPTRDRSQETLPEATGPSQPGSGREFTQAEVDAYAELIENPPLPSPEAEATLKRLGLSDLGTLDLGDADEPPTSSRTPEELDEFIDMMQNPDRLPEAKRREMQELLAELGLFIDEE